FVRTFKVQPVPRRGVGVGADDEKRGVVTHVYNLRRGRTYASIEGCEVARDGRWTAISTDHRTVHVFATNPYGGPGDVASHVDGRVRNVDVVQFPLTELQPVARLRPKAVMNEQTPHAVPLAVTFLSPLALSNSPNLLPTHQRSSSQTRHPTSSPNTSTSPLVSSPNMSKKPTNFQDVLIFDPLDSTLSLYRLVVDKHLARESGIASLGVTSISLPGLGGLSGSSPSKSLLGGGGMMSRASSTSTNREREREKEQYELSVKDSVVATWSLARRGKEWVEVKKPLKVPVKRDVRRGVDWLAETEITTCSKSKHVLPRSLYLSHQFSFYTLGEDYHALIRRLHLDIVGPKIEVRTTVSINTFATPPSSGAFMEDFDTRRHSTASGMSMSPPSFDFDEPIANAISGSFDNTNIPAILPMFPNGVAGSTKPKGFRNAIPIRSVTGGVSEGIGRLRSQMGRGGGGGRAHGGVPLEFDEEDEDFLAPPPVLVSGGATSDFLNADVVGTVDEEIFNGWDG
ncbi:hypothetical protein CVT24_007880, partial [Panaeolus cyanescens]